MRTLNRVLKRYLPNVQSALKRAARQWFAAQSPLPVVKKLGGRILFLHPQFLLQRMDDYEPHVARWLERSLKQGSVFFDVGANCGIHAIRACKAVGAHGKVFAFEPAPKNIIALRYHLSVNRLRQCRIVSRAVSDRTGTGRFYLFDDFDQTRHSLTTGGDNVPFIGDCARTEILVPTISLDEFCANEGAIPDVVKIDVEGAEFLVLKGAVDLLKKHRPVVILAVHPFWLCAGENTDQMVAFLKDVGYGILSEQGQQVEMLDYGEYLCLPNGVAGSPASSDFRQTHGI